MPDILTPSERAMIDGAVLKGMVKRIPLGVGTFNPPQYKWNGVTLEAVAPAEGTWNGRHYRKDVVAVKARREKVYAMTKAGNTAKEIAFELKENYTTIVADLRVLRSDKTRDPLPDLRYVATRKQLKLEAAE